ncbi:MAG: 2-oxoacid:acceptor oxidoreductase subunit alpha, partial [Anaerovoracaceae bacterium]
MESQTVEPLPRGGRKVILQGNEACARAAVYAGCRFFAGYPITPSTEIIEYLSAEMINAGGTFIQMEDEIASACAIVGARWGGKKAMTATSGPGFTLMQETIGFAAVTETPVVIVNVQRGGPSTGQPTMSSQQDIYQVKYGSHGDYEIIALTPSSVQEMYDFTIRAFELSEKFRTPVILLADEVVGHMREKITIYDGER